MHVSVCVNFIDHCNYWRQSIRFLLKMDKCAPARPGLIESTRLFSRNFCSFLFLCEFQHSLTHTHTTPSVTLNARPKKSEFFPAFRPDWSISIGSSNKRCWLINQIDTIFWPTSEPSNENKITKHSNGSQFSRTFLDYHFRMWRFDVIRAHEHTISIGLEIHCDAFVVASVILTANRRCTTIHLCLFLRP